jgi:lipopolysaccharide transport protein LptA
VKIIYLIAWLALTSGGWSQAQTNLKTAPTVITSKQVVYGNGSREVIYTGSVQVDDPRMKLTCEQLTANLPLPGAHIDHLVALTNVVMDSVDEKGQTNHATSDMAVYDYNVKNGVTNETVTLTGNARVRSGQDWMTGEPIVWDRVNNSMRVENPKMILYQNSTNSLMNPNTSPAKTNFPPGTIQNIDRMTPVYRTAPDSTTTQ